MGCASLSRSTIIHQEFDESSSMVQTEAKFNLDQSLDINVAYYIYRILRIQRATYD